LLTARVNANLDHAGSYRSKRLPVERLLSFLEAAQLAAGRSPSEIVEAPKILEGGVAPGCDESKDAGG
jgi:hypothetical protein